MKKENPWFILALCLSLFMVGLIFGSAARLPSGFISAMNGVLANLASFATVIAAVFAFYAWKSWRQQFILTETFKASVEMCASIAEVRHLESYLVCLRAWFGTQYEELTDDQLVRLEEDFKAKQKLWGECQYRYTSVYYTLSSLDPDVVSTIKLNPAFFDQLMEEVNPSGISSRALIDTSLDLWMAIVSKARKESFWAADVIRKKAADSIKSSF
ncbi:hypothetical protein [Pseudomonas nitroreducens]|uniref:hypothetical protein n=1 Tax=Pseudomonas nitroreducens TaxID=46680 RepID=UPI003CC83860